VRFANVPGSTKVDAARRETFHAPHIGEHTEATLWRHGLEAGAIASLVERGVIGIHDGGNS